MCNQVYNQVARMAMMNSIKKLRRQRRLAQSPDLQKRDDMIRSKIEEAGGLYICPQCDRTFTRRVSLESHIKRTHPEEEEEDDQPSRKRARIEEDTPGPYQCQVCDRTFRRKASLLQHEQSHIEDDDDREEEICTDQKEEEADRPTCNLCGKSYSRADTLKWHIRTKHEGKGFACQVCHKHYDSRHLLQTHIQRRHHPQSQQQMSLACTMCGTVFDNLDTLNRHVQTAHATSSQNVCRVCGNVYDSQVRLEKHVRRRHGSTVLVASEESVWDPQLDSLADMFSCLDVSGSSTWDESSEQSESTEGTQDVYTVVDGSFWLDWVPPPEPVMVRWCSYPGTVQWDPAYNNAYTQSTSQNVKSEDESDVSISSVFNVLLDV